MRKADLIAAIVAQAQLSDRQADDALTAMLESIVEVLALQQTVRISGFGTFLVSAQAERIGRHPGTGEKITIAAHQKPHFRPAKQLRQALL